MKEKTRIQNFRPKDEGVLKRARQGQNYGSPTVDDIKQMAEDTIADASQHILHQKRMIENAKKTIAEAEEKRNGSD